MMRTMKSIGIIATIGIMLVGAYLLGTTQAETTIEVNAMTDVKGCVPNGYIPLEECIPFQDIACFFIDGYDYPCFELKDVGHQLDDPNNRSYVDIMESMVDETENFRNEFIDMRKVVDFDVYEDGFQLYFVDGTVYYWER